MSDEVLESQPIAHGVWFWRLAIFEGISSIFVVMGGAVLAASATWDSATMEKMEPWQWKIFWLGISVSGVKALQAFMSKTVSSLTAKAAQSLPYTSANDSSKASS